MTKKSYREIASSVAEFRWLFWQAIRFHPLYRGDVAHLLIALRSRAPVMKTPTGRGMRVPTEWTAFNAAELDAIVVYRQLLKTVRAGRVPRAQDARVAARLSNPRLGLLPELQQFQAKWPLKFPVPPGSSEAPTSFFTPGMASPLKYVAHTTRRLTLDLYLPAGKTALLGLLRGALDQSQLHRDTGEAISRKPGGRSSQISTRTRGDWLRVGISHPARANMDNIVRVVKPRLRRGPITLAARDHYLQVFAAWERLTACPRRKRLEIAQELKLVDPKALDPNALEAVDEEERGLHRLRSLERTYRHLVRAFGLPAIPPRATAPQR